jgi:DNA polymerase
MAEDAAVDERTRTLALIDEEIRACTRCPLSETRTRAVPGEGPLDAEIMFIGEGPGFHEDRQGRPFVGAAGRFLEELLASIGLQREQVFITNVVKCRPPENRDPAPNEIEACVPYYLDRQIALIDPRVIVTLGRFSMARFFPGKSISRIHGQPRREGGRIIFPMLHPAAALHLRELRESIEQDMLKIPALLEEARQGATSAAPPAEEGDEDHPQQLTLF